MAIFTLKRKLFSTKLTDERHNVLSFTETSLLNVMKLIYLAGNCLPNDKRHWINHLASSLTKSGDPIKVFLGIVDNYKNLPKQFNKSYVKELRGDKTVKEYLKDLFDTLRTKKEKEIVKYGHLLPTSLTDAEIKELIQKLKYIALCLSGQLNPDYVNLWDKEVATTQVNWDTGKGMEVDSEYLTKIIENII